MAVALSRSQDEINQLPLVELAWEILKATGQPFYFRDLMNEIQALRGLSEEQVMEVIAKLYTEINIDGRFLCVGQNVWGLKRWYPVDKVAEKGKRFVRASGDAFSDDDEDDEEYEDDLVTDELEDIPLFGDSDEDPVDSDTEDGFVVDDEDSEFSEEEEESETEFTDEEDGMLEDDSEDDEPEEEEE